jgi:glycosyltransferase involved in cell wall biosynthesis
MNVGVFDMGGAGWTGGLTYLRNLAHAVKTTIPEQLTLVLVRKPSTGPKQEDWVSSFFDDTLELEAFGGVSRPLYEFIRRGLSLLAGGDVLDARRFEKSFRARNIQVLFGQALTSKFKLPSVGWYPDFQHVDLPELFTRTDILLREYCVKRMARNCTLMVFSSNHARKGFQRLHPARAHKARILKFVAHLPPAARQTDPAYVVQKYHLPEKFIYLPNQLWLHKNHLTAFSAVKLLSEKNQCISLVCSGNLTDSAHPEHKDRLFQYIKENGLSDRILVLGMVDFADVYALIRQACCVLNPSLYEGWSTTVEETKTIGKPMLLSDLEVHREQDPPATLYFEPKNAVMLAEMMVKVWDAYPAGPNPEMERRAAEQYVGRSRAFAQTFADICCEAVELRGGAKGRDV